MHVTLPQSEADKNVEAIKRAIDFKIIEVESAQRKVADLQAELRGLRAALEVINPKR